MKKILFTLAAVATVLSGCNRTEVETSGREGLLQLQIGYSGYYNDKTPELVPVRSAADDQAFIDTFIISIDKISGTSSYSLECTVAEFNRMYADGILTLSPGDYRVEVTSPGSTNNAAWDQPVYSVAKDFTIIEDVMTPLELVCTLSNMKVSVRLSDNFKSELSAYSIIVTGEYETGNASLTWSSADAASEGRAGYFAVAPLTVEIQGVRQLDGSEANKTYLIEDVAAADHHILNIDAKVTGSAGLSVSIDYTVNEKPVDIVVPGFEEIPVPDEDPDDNPDTDPDDPSSTAPELVWENNPSFDPTPISSTMDIVLLVNAPEKIAEFTVDIDSDILRGILNNMTFPLDLINDETVKGFMGSLGLPVGDQLLGQVSVEFPLSGLVPLIGQIGAPAGSEHTFTLYVKDEKGQELSRKLVFYMPE